MRSRTSPWTCCIPCSIRASAIASMAALHHRSLVAGLLIFFLLIAVVFAAPLLNLPDPTAQDPMQTFIPPSAQHLMGTDAFGRELLSRVLYGGRTTIVA